jgi:hypothetical protein
MRADMREFSTVLVAFAVLMVVYAGALVVSNYFNIRAPSSPLVQEARSVGAALRNYYVSRGSYPVLSDRPLLELKKILAEGGYLPADSADVGGPDKAARYHSGGQGYGLLFHFDYAGKNSPRRPCLMEVGAYNTGWWAQPPKCPF